MARVLCCLMTLGLFAITVLAVFALSHLQLSGDHQLFLKNNSDQYTEYLKFKDSYSITGTDPVAMNGQINASMAVVGDETTASVNGSGLTMTADCENISFSDYSVTVAENDLTGSSSMTASMSVTSSIDGTITVDVNPALFTPDDFSDYPISGTIEMTHSDGSILTINADTGNPATFSYLVNENGATTTGTANRADTVIDLS